MRKSSVFVSEHTSAGWQDVSASDHQAAVEAVASRVEDGRFQWGSVQTSDNGQEVQRTFIAPKPR